MLTTALTVIISLSFLIFVHELGHFLAAKRVGVHVLEFSIGFPPKVISKVVGKTEYLISLIPIGGYVRLKGQGIEDEDENDPENYASKSILQRFFILIAGPFMNLAVTLILMPLVFFIGYEIPAYLQEIPVVGSVTKDSHAEQLNFRKNDVILAVNGNQVKNWKDVQDRLGDSNEEFVDIKLARGTEINHRRFASSLMKQEGGFGLNPKISPVVGKVSEGSPAAFSVLQTGDRIYRIAEQDIDEWSQISPIVQSSNGKQMEVVVDRNGQQLVFMITPEWNESNKYWVLGISSESIRVSDNFADSISKGFQRTYLLTYRTLEFLFRLISGKEDGDSVGGPIMIAKMMGQAAETSVSSLLTLVAFISLQFAIFNLLPIPALDGGHIFFLLLEKISGKSLSKNLRMSIQRIGFSLLMLLIIYISIQDGIRLFGG